MRQSVISAMQFLPACTGISLYWKRSGRWQSPEETYQGRHYQYLIEGAAFDWQLLAERLCEAVDGLLPEKEKSDFLLKGNLRWTSLKNIFRNSSASVKYRQYLNYFYGVTVEDALLLSVKDEVRKERRPGGNCEGRRYYRRGFSTDLRRNPAGPTGAVP